MAKPHDDDPIELARLAREFQEKMARRGHRAHESTDPPPPRKRVVSQVDLHLEEASHKAKHLKELWAFLAVVVVALVAGGVWAHTRPSMQYVDDGDEKVRQYIDGKNAQLQRQAEALVRIEQQVKDMRESDDKRWDKLDKILDRQFGQSTTVPPPPSFGPAAKAKGKQ